MIEIVLETHSTSEDNEAGRATGWLPGRLSERGRTQARELGDRRRTSGILDDLAPRWQGRRVLIIGHGATRWSLDHFVRGIPLEDLVAEDFAWQPGWEYRVG
jgi:broad specificity phosphatase PhoE